jgi:TRAP-type transport system small permease protein
MDKLIHSFSKSLHYIAQLILLFIVIVVTLDAFGRSVFTMPIQGAYEMTEQGLALLVFFSLSYTFLKGDHIAIDFVVDKFSESLKSTINIIINFLIFIVMLLVTWQMWNNAMRLMKANLVTGDLGLPVYAFILLAAVGTIAFMLTALMKCIRSILKVAKKNES